MTAAGGPGTRGLDLAEVLAGPATTAAPALLGAHLVVDRGGLVAVRIVEVEAYGGDDPASHAHRGPTPRNRSMFGAPGHAYVYRSHGIHLCCNIVCGPPGIPMGVLLRGGVVVRGRELAIRRRGGRDGDEWLAAGPGRLGQAVGIRADDDGVGVLGSGAVRLVPGNRRRGEEVAIGPRVGVSRAAERPWRFWLAGSRGVSAYRRSGRAV